jgi:phosphate uptake regulator
VANAFGERLPEASRLLEAEDNNLEEMYVVLTTELAAGDLRPPVLLEMALVARFLKRLGDHAVESARWIASFSGPGPRLA